ncbi:integrin-linked protein kinase [Caerostris extrusa]|uniref:Integrin-linked protein kinase n=1 Tax=Caerostris extrusa TaxID=172846 RepID=A0AAV4PK99_CAEEX|nr:integrin-linked protein kinase [Caerostris extrusa]
MTRETKSNTRTSDVRNISETARLVGCSRSTFIDDDLTARINMADAKFSFQEKGKMYGPVWIAPEALQKKPEEINVKVADMWSYAILLWELATREVPFADLSPMESGMKVALEGLRITIPPGISRNICHVSFAFV